ncbi:MAG: hypothetical protein JXA89_01825 [Anaerolineae bacterium]|nr:hypothetical protein [Anaerolineae bacterium]
MDCLFAFLFLLIAPVVLLIAKIARPATFRTPSTRQATIHLIVAVVALAFIIGMVFFRPDGPFMPLTAASFLALGAWVVYRTARRLHLARWLDHEGVLVQAVGIDISLGSDDEQHGVRYVYGDDWRGQSPLGRWIKRASDSRRIEVVVRYLPDQPQVHRIQAIVCEGEVLLEAPPSYEVRKSGLKTRAERQREQAQKIRDLSDELSGAGLSDPIAEYTAGGKPSIVAGIVILFLAGALIFALSIATLQGTVDQMCPGYGLSALVLLLLAFGIFLLTDRQVRFLVFPEGVARLAGKRVDLYRWETVDAVIQEHKLKSNGRMRHRYLVQCQDGHTLTLTDRIPFVDALIAELEQSRLEHELPPLLRAYRDGGTLVFGALSLDLAGLHCGQTVIPTQEIGGAQVIWGRNGGSFEIKRTGRWESLPQVDADNTPNLGLLIALLDQVAVPGFECASSWEDELEPNGR